MRYQAFLAAGVLVGAALVGCGDGNDAPSVTSTVAAPVTTGEAGAPSGEAGAPSGEHQVFQADRLAWAPAPDSLPEGAQVVVLEGDPTKDGPLTMRLKFPDGLEVAPHHHPAIERVTVLDGTLAFGHGSEANWDATEAVGPGGYIIVPVGSPHYVRAQGEVIIQLNSTGLWGITYVNPEDDPRTK